MDRERKEFLEKEAKRIRYLTVDCIGSLGEGHIGGSLSIADVLAVLYNGVMNVDPENPKMEGRDQLVCSKGHAGPAVYATLASRGFFPEEWLHTLNQPHTLLPSHCDKNRTPGVDMTTGSLGQGISVAMGMAAGQKLKGSEGRVYVILGDGESQEGQVWEAIMFANQYHLDNLTVLLDYNKQQIDGTVDEVVTLGDPKERYAAFGFDVQEVDGHDVEAIENALLAAKEVVGKPQLIVLHTVKGKGVSIVQNAAFNHYMTFTKEQVSSMLAELSE
ncbi:MAG: transketolase [Lachnospiraceae bacterium]|nr:transketolase [Lachnospiraceae bacterium]